ncbi:glycosyltransferase [Tripterygium wilfordii]|uniref:Glycosyltransferase n=1 Tax=Tripterygium wilfordii TaxID=458696 RepID=A0A7J7DS89_TRIWF|nr:glycosyltransferase [Tripterygium wilfordii]
MANSSFLLHYYNNRRLSASSRSFFFIPTTLALLTSLFILLYIYTTSNLFTYHHQHHRHIHLKPPLDSSSIARSTHGRSIPISVQNGSINLYTNSQKGAPLVEDGSDGNVGSQRSSRVPFHSTGEFVSYNEVFHDKDIFLEDYKEMNRSFKIYVYPHRRNDSFANALLPVDFEPGGNYASESYFKKVLMKSHFITKDPERADLFFLPFSIARLRHDPRIGVGGIQDFIRDYIFNISQKYPYWNRTGGADHFYVACHSIGRSAMEKAVIVRYNSIQVVCSSSYFLSGYITHKDASLPQVWPRQGDPPNFASSKRKKLAFFAGSINSPVREKLIQVWGNDSEISAHFGRLKTPYADELLQSKFCLHVKGFEVNTARIADSLYYGCVPVIIANHYDLPFADILNWQSFAVIVATLDIPLLKKILKGITFSQYLMLQRNVLEVRKHFQWHLSPVNYDAFYTVMYELWLRRSSTRVPLSASADFNG